MLLDSTLTLGLFFWIFCIRSCWLTIRKNSRIKEENREIIRIPSLIGLAQESYCYLQPVESDRLEIKPEYSYDAEMRVEKHGEEKPFAVLSIPNTTNMYNIAATLHEVGHVLEHSPHSGTSWTKSLSPDFKGILNLGLVFSPFALIYAVLSIYLETPHVPCIIFSFAIAVLYSINIGEERRAWDRAKLYNDNKKIIPSENFENVKRVCLGSYSIPFTIGNELITLFQKITMRLENLK